MRILSHISLLLVVLMYSAGLPIVSHYCHHAQRHDVGLWTAGEDCTHHDTAHAQHHQLPACCQKHLPEGAELSHEDGNCCDTEGTFFKLPDHEHSVFAKLVAPAPSFLGWVNYDQAILVRMAEAAAYARPPPDIGRHSVPTNDRLARLDTWLL